MEFAELQIVLQPLLTALLGPLGGLVLSLMFSFLFLSRFEKTTERLFDLSQTELELCQNRYDTVLTELMKLKNQ